MLVEQPEGGVEVADLGESGSGQGGEGVASGEAGLAATEDPVEYGAGVVACSRCTAARCNSPAGGDETPPAASPSSQPAHATPRNCDLANPR